MAEGEVKQIGSPDELYEQPASDFVMSFLGPVTQINGQLVRPHDLELLTTAEPGALEAVVHRVTRLGFEVRVDLATSEGRAWAQVTRATAEHLDLQSGQQVWVLPHHARTSIAAT